MNGSLWIRQSHRWLSIIFTLTVAANFAVRALGQGDPPPWLTYSPLPPLFVQLITGLYLFALPYVGTRRSARESEPPRPATRIPLP